MHTVYNTANERHTSRFHFRRRNMANRCRILQSQDMKHSDFKAVAASKQAAP